MQRAACTAAPKGDPHPVASGDLHCRAAALRPQGRTAGGDQACELDESDVWEGWEWGVSSSGAGCDRLTYKLTVDGSRYSWLGTVGGSSLTEGSFWANSLTSLRDHAHVHAHVHVHVHVHVRCMARGEVCVCLRLRGLVCVRVSSWRLVARFRRVWFGLVWFGLV